MPPRGIQIATSCVQVLRGGGVVASQEWADANRASVREGCARRLARSVTLLGSSSAPRVKLTSMRQRPNRSRTGVTMTRVWSGRVWALARGATLLALQAGANSRSHPAPPPVSSVFVDPPPAVRAYCGAGSDGLQGYAKGPNIDIRDTTFATMCRALASRIPASVTYNQPPTVRTAILWRRSTDRPTFELPPSTS